MQDSGTMDAFRKQLDALMGANRNGDVLEVKRNYWDRDVCRLYLTGLCPHDLFQLTVRSPFFLRPRVSCSDRNLNLLLIIIFFELSSPWSFVVYWGNTVALGFHAPKHLSFDFELWLRGSIGTDSKQLQPSIALDNWDYVDWSAICRKWTSGRVRRYTHCSCGKSILFKLLEGFKCIIFSAIVWALP